MASILVISKDSSVCRTISSCFETDGKTACIAGTDAALEMLRRQRFDYIFVDLVLLRESAQGLGYKHVLQPFWLIFPTVEIIVMSSADMIREAVKAVKEGASNYLSYPLTADEVKYVTESIYESQLVESELNFLRNQFWQADSHKLIQTNSPLMKQIYGKIRSVAPTVSTVLLLGETGTGKGVLARIIHKHSSRSNAQFISVHCGAIPENLIESELFGHEKGAFTGAVRRRLGKFEIAKDGTIFLDEVSTISAAAQIKLLQVLQEKIFQRVGGEDTIDANVRIIAATNIDLMELCAAGLFRKDLYYRLNVFPIEIPPLRERKEDIPLLVDTFIRELNKFSNKDIHGIHPDVEQAFMSYSWPGNIRELENLIERAYILEETSIMSATSFPAELFASRPQLNWGLSDTSLTLAETRRAGMDVLEKSYLSELLREKKGRIMAAAETAGISTRQLNKLMKKHEFHKEDFK